MSYLKTKIGDVLRWYQKDIKHLFTSVNIETYAYCNRQCHFCFNHDSFPSREKGIMDETMFYGFIDQLAALNFAGRISPILYGEPLLEKRLIPFIEYMETNLPYAEIWLNTNGDYLTDEIMQQLIQAGLDCVFVTNYDDEAKPNLDALAEKYNETIVYRRMSERRIVNRAGSLMDRESTRQDLPCLRPTGQLVVNWKGDVLLCCNDYYAKYSFGNLKDVSVLDAWQSPAFDSYRDMLRKKGGRAKIDLCKNCDM